MSLFDILIIISCNGWRNLNINNANVNNTHANNATIVTKVKHALFTGYPCAIQRFKLQRTDIMSEKTMYC